MIYLKKSIAVFRYFLSGRNIVCAKPIDLKDKINIRNRIIDLVVFNICIGCR